MSHTFLIAGDDGLLLRSQVEVEGNDLVLHSRSGLKADGRNPDYRPALEAILKRLAERRVIFKVYLDSRPFAHLPLADRIMGNSSQFSGDPREQFKAILRAMNAGSSSNGSYRRLRVRVEGLSGLALLFAVRGTPELRSKPERPPHDGFGPKEVKGIGPDHIRKAAARMLAGDRAPNFAPSSDYDAVVEGGRRLAPKALYGLAAEEGLALEAFPTHFGAGFGKPCFTAILEAGYPIVAKIEVEDDPEDPTLDPVLNDEEERSWAEGDMRIVSHLRNERRRNPAVAREKRKAVKAANGGRLVCDAEGCAIDWYKVYPDGIAESVFEIHHTTPLHQTTEDGTDTTLADVVCLCASCHRAQHRRLTLAIKSAD